MGKKSGGGVVKMHRAAPSLKNAKKRSKRGKKGGDDGNCHWGKFEDLKKQTRGKEQKQGPNRGGDHGIGRQNQAPPKKKGGDPPTLTRTRECCSSKKMDALREVRSDMEEKKEGVSEEKKKKEEAGANFTLSGIGQTFGKGGGGPRAPGSRGGSKKN